MALPFKKGSGSFLNGVSGVLNNLTFKLGKKGTQKDGTPWQMYSGVAVITPDGGKPTEQFLNAGFLDAGFSISKDGRSIEGDGEYQLDTDTQLGKFVVSMVEGDGQRVPEELLGDLRNYEGIAGTRATFVRVVDEEATKRLGKSKSKKTGKEYDRDNLLISEVISLPETKKGAAKKTAAPKAAAKTAAPAAAAAPAATAEAAAPEQTDDALKAIVEAAGGTIEAGKLSAAAVRYAMKNQSQYDPKAREALRTAVTDDAYLAGAVERGAIVIEGEGKDRTVILAA